MNNFEKAQTLIEELLEENTNLKKKLKVALWEVSKPTVVEPQYTNKQVGLSEKMRIIEKEKDAAMKRFTRRMQNDARKYREARDGKS